MTGFYPAHKAELERQRGVGLYQAELRRAWRRIERVVDWGRPMWEAPGDPPLVPPSSVTGTVLVDVLVDRFRFRRQRFQYRPPSPKAGKVGHIIVGQGPGRTDWTPIDGLLPPYAELGEIL